MDERAVYLARICYVYPNLTIETPARSNHNRCDRFGSAALGDPATDLASLSTYGERFLERCYPAYPVLTSQAMRERAAFYRSTFALQQALWAKRAGDEEEFWDGIAAYT